MSDWNPAAYLRFESERTRPAADLLARVPLTAPVLVFDLGCGPGNSTHLLAERFPHARLVGIDSSEAMLAAARHRCPGAEFLRGDLASWMSPERPDLIYSNAALHWLPAHGQLLPRLLAQLAPGGVIAIQMPDNLGEPSHRLMRDIAAEPRFAAYTHSVERPPLLTVQAYYDLFAPFAEVDVWRTTYHHPLAGADAIVEWLQTSGLKPFLDALPPALRDPFRCEYRRAVDAAYPARADGTRLLAFPRLFIVARRRVR